MSGNHLQNGETGCWFSGKPPKFLKISPAWLTVFIALNGFAVAAVVMAASLAIQFAVVSWKGPPLVCPDPQTTAPSPSVVQILAPYQGGNASSNVVLDPEQNPWINKLIDAVHYAGKPDAVAPGLSARIWEQMDCPSGKRLKMSGFIRFSNNDASVDDAKKKSIDNFLKGIDKQGTRWGVFGFASEAGEKRRNRELSWQRACKVTKHISDKYSCATSGLDCTTCPSGRNGKVEVRYKCPASGNRETEFFIRFLGEDHFINGVADSRSVIIAACRTK